MASTRKSKRKEKRGGESSTVSGTGGSHLSSDSESSANSSKSKRTLRKSGRIIIMTLKKNEKNKQSQDLAYDGDKENSSENSSDGTSNSTDAYEFDEVDVIPMQEKSTKKQKGGKKTKTAVKRTGDKKIPSIAPKVSVKTSDSIKRVKAFSSTPVFAEVNTNLENKKMGAVRGKRKLLDHSVDSGPKKGTKRPSISPISSTPFTDSSVVKKQCHFQQGIRRSKRKMADSINITPAISKAKEKIPVNSEREKGDSGMFVSPPPRKLLRLAAKDTSTPSELSKPKSNDCSTRLGEDESVSLLFSPVEKLFTPSYTTGSSPTSDYGSMVNSLSQFSLVDVKIPRPSLDEYEPELKLNKSITESYKRPKMKIKKNKNRFSISKVDAWAEKVNDQFDEIEKFELSIEG